jgi:hypothetical protein
MVADLLLKSALEDPFGRTGRVPRGLIFQQSFAVRCEGDLDGGTINTRRGILQPNNKMGRVSVR